MRLITPTLTIDLREPTDASLTSPIKTLGGRSRTGKFKSFNKRQMPNLKVTWTNLNRRQAAVILTNMFDLRRVPCILRTQRMSLRVVCITDVSALTNTARSATSISMDFNVLENLRDNIIPALPDAAVERGTGIQSYKDAVDADASTWD